MMQKSRYFALIVLLIGLAGCNQTSTKPPPVQHQTEDTKSAELNMRLGMRYIQRGEYRVALEKLNKSLRQDPNLPSGHNAIAILYQRLNETEKAESHFKEAIQRDPEFSSAHNNYGAFLCDQKRYDEAEKQFLEAVSNPLYERPGQVYENAGLCLNRIPDQTRAEKYFRKALQTDPYLAKSLLHMAKLRLLDVDYVEAKSYLKRYQEVARWTPQALLTAIKIERRLGDEDAVASYSLLLRGNFPDSEEALQVKMGQF